MSSGVYDNMDSEIQPWLPPPMRNEPTSGAPLIPVEKYGHWGATDWQLPTNHNACIKNLVWSYWATATQTGEQIPLQYFSPAVVEQYSTIESPEQLETLQHVAEETARRVLAEMVTEAIHGVGYVTGVDVEGYVDSEVQLSLADMLQGLLVLPQERFGELQNVITIAIAQGVQKWQESLQKIHILGGDLDKQSGKGVPIPIQPIQPNQE